MHAHHRTKALALLVSLGLMTGSAFSQQTTTVTVVPPQGAVLITKQAAVAQAGQAATEGELPAQIFAGDARPVTASSPDTQAEDPEARKKAERQKKIQQLTFDRRPSAILAAWSTPQDRPVAQDEGKDEAVDRPDGGTPKPAASLLADEVAAALAEFDEQLRTFQRNITLGQWDEAGHFLESLPEDEAKALYKRLVAALPNPPGPGASGPSVPQPGTMGTISTTVVSRPTNPQFMEKNTFTGADVVALAEIAPVDLDDQLIAGLGRILNLAIEQGTSVDDAVSRLKREVERPDDQAAVTRRQAARLLMAAGQATMIGAFLPSVEEAEKADDREALNLLSSHYLALHAREPKDEHLERAWAVNQAVLAVGEVDRDVKKEALKRAVELAPRVREDLGQVWLAESFAERPDRGMEIIAAIGAAAAQGLQSQPMDPEFRRKSLELQKTAVEALLVAAPDRAQSWRRSLELLAMAWRNEAEFSRMYDTSTSRGPVMQRDSFGNLYYLNPDGPVPSEMMVNRSNMPRPIPVGEILKVRPGPAWIEILDDALLPDFAATFARLHLKVGEEDEAFPHIEELASAHPEQAEDLVEEFLRVWTRNHDPNATRNLTSPYMFIYGFERKAESIPLTRSKQERNLQELAGWVRRIKALPIGDVEESLLTAAFTACHSSAEVYRLEAIEDVFGSIDELEPETLASLIQQMRENLAGLWRQPAVQEQNKTRRKEKDIQAEVLRGYELAGAVIEQALDRNPDHWALVQARAAILHDENNYRRELDPSSDFAPRRRESLDEFRRAAALYAEAVPGLSEEDETTQVFEQWFYASLGACDLGMIDEEKIPVAAEPPAIRAAIEGLPGGASERHLDRFANGLFTRMSGLNPAAKFAYLRAGFEIVGDREQAREARKVFDYYKDLVNEIQLDAKVDGPDVVGHGRPFGLYVNLRHTREIERESGGFGRYLQNQNTGNSYYYNYGRPLENYRDKFEEAAREALQEHFEVISVTFENADVTSKADDDYGWRITPYAHILLEARSPKVDTIPPLRLDLDFLDTSGYVILPVESPAIPIDAAPGSVPPRPFNDLQITQTLDERQADAGKLILEVKAVAHGLVPELDEILDLGSEGFDVVGTEDQGLAVSKFDEQSDETEVLSERTWLVSFQAQGALPERPKVFHFAPALVDAAGVTYQRYDDADLAEVGPVANLEERYGRASRARLWWALGIALMGAVAAVVAWLAWPRREPVAVERFRLPEAITPFTVLGLLRDIERQNGFPSPQHAELVATIGRLESHYFAAPAGAEPDLRSIAEEWLRRTR